MGSQISEEVIPIKRFHQPKHHRWEPWEDDFLRLTYYDFDSYDVDSILKRGINPVRRRCRELFGFRTRSSKFEPWEQDFLRLACIEHSFKELSSILHSTPGTISQYCTKNLGLFKKDEIKIGGKFGRLTVLSFSHTTDKGYKIYLCKCDCGKERTISSTELGRTQSCGCLRLEKISNSCEFISGKYYGDVRKNAKNRKLLFDVSIQYLNQLLIDQNHKCKLSGFPIKIDTSRKDWVFGITTASLDRINSDMGYIEGNLQWVHKDLNYMKHVHTQERFVELCNKVSEYQKEINQNDIEYFI